MVFDYIFCGYGMSAAMVLDELYAHDLLWGKSVLIIDRGEDIDKTWCFWERGKGDYDTLITRQWSSALFNAKSPIEILRGHYTYKMLKSHVLLQAVTSKLEMLSGVQFLTDMVTDIRDDGSSVCVKTVSGSYTGHKVFNSMSTEMSASGNYPVLLQHFRGWVVECKTPCFDPDTAIFMDFTIPQNGNTRFVYTLPFSPTRALVEYTLFSPAGLPAQEYESGIADYLAAKGVSDYEVVGTEFGVIPMTAFPFWKDNTKNVLHIGTRGGWTKPSTGYTFVHAGKLARRLAHGIAQGKTDFSKFMKRSRFAWYDSIFVSVLFHHNDCGKHIFGALFEKAPPEVVLRFLREETTLFDEVRIVLACPKLLFLKHLLRVSAKLKPKRADTF